MNEVEGRAVRLNELVMYSAIGCGEADKRGPITGEDIGRYVAYLVSSRPAASRGQTIHLKSPEHLEVVP